MNTPISLASGYGNFAVPPEAVNAAARAFQTSPLTVLPAAGSEALRAALAAGPAPLTLPRWGRPTWSSPPGPRRRCLRC
ncbi:hypothetical protein [Hymenobacter lapidiphilus]|uniref:hypothetical protein n=1 Tax=Hymenobacter sp. CCM 8763 TaxID=2303334 RepID=UPI00167C5347|nr:hypothetical protein [Hymenobacter sp. CCM 8763]